MGAAEFRPPRVRVAALIVLDGHVVAVRHRRGDSRYHLLPGGGVEPGESIGEALMREVAEETGLVIRVGRPLIVSDLIDPNTRKHVINLTFAVEVVGGEITDRPVDDIVEAVDLISPDRLQDLDLRPPIAAEVSRLVAEPESAAVYLGSLYTPERD